MKQRAPFCVLLEQWRAGLSLGSGGRQDRGSGDRYTTSIGLPVLSAPEWLEAFYLHSSWVYAFFVFILSLSLKMSYSISVSWIIQDKDGILCARNISATLQDAEELRFPPLLLLSHSRLLPAKGKNFTFCNILMAKQTPQELGDICWTAAGSQPRKRVEQPVCNLSSCSVTGVQKNGKNLDVGFSWKFSLPKLVLPDATE